MAGAGCRLARRFPVGPGKLLGSVSTAVRFPDRPLPTASGERRTPRLLKASRQSREYIYPVFSAVFLPGHTQRVSLCSPGAPTPHGSAQRLSCAVIHQSVELVWTTLLIFKEPCRSSRSLCCWRSMGRYLPWLCLKVFCGFGEALE